MKNKPLSAYKRKKLIESFCDELTATQAAHRLNLDRNTVNKYFKRIRECIAGYREYRKMTLMISVMSTPEQQVQSFTVMLPSLASGEREVPVRVMCIDGQLVTDINTADAVNGSKYMMNISGYFNGHVNGLSAHPYASPEAVDCSDIQRLAGEFLSFASLRFKKFFGIRSGFAYLYIKEAEFVFNERDHARRAKVLLKMTERIFL